MKNQEQKIFQRDLVISFILHLIFIGVFIYGIPSIFEKLPEENQVIVFEMLTVSDIVNVRNQNIKTSEPKEIKEAQKIKKSTVKEEQEEETPKEETPIEKKLDTPEKELPIPPKKEAEIVSEKKKDITPPKKEEKQNKAPPPKKEKEQLKPKKIDVPKKVIKKQEDPLDSILKNLEKESDGNEIKSLNRTTPSQANEGKFAKGDHDEDSPLSITEKMLIKQQVENNWRPPVGAANLENIRLLLHLKLAADGAVTEVTVKNITCPLGAEQTCDLVAESAKRATKKASPIENLRPERYDLWKEFDLNFDPSNIMQ